MVPDYHMTTNDCLTTIYKIKRVQRRATRIPSGFEKLEYADRLIKNT